MFDLIKITENSDIVGLKFNKLTVLQYVGFRVVTKGGTKRAHYLCQCDCGKQLHVHRLALRSNNTKSCGCLNDHPIVTATSQAKDYTGHRFGKLVATRRFHFYSSNRNKTSVRYECQCDCGNIITSSTGSLQSGNTKSCGCFNIEQIILRNHDPALIIKRQKNVNDSKTFTHWKTGTEIITRGSYESRVIEFLNAAEVDYAWQIPFKLSNGKVYLCDLYLIDLDLYIEIKGWWRDDALLKWTMFREEYPHLEAEVWMKDELQKLTN